MTRARKMVKKLLQNFNEEMTRDWEMRIGRGPQRREHSNIQGSRADWTK